MCIPRGHVDKRGVFAVEPELQHLRCSDAPKANDGLPAHDGKALHLPGMEVVAAGDAGNGGGEARLSGAEGAHQLGVAAAGVGVGDEGAGIYRCLVGEAAVGVEEVDGKFVGQRGDDAAKRVGVAVAPQGLQQVADTDRGGWGDGAEGVDCAGGGGADAGEDFAHHFGDVDEAKVVVDIDGGGFAAVELMREGGDDGVVKGPSEGAVDVGDDEAGEGGAGAAGPGGEAFAPFALGAGVGGVEGLLHGGGEEEVRGGAGGIQRGDEAVGKAEVGLIQLFRIGVAVDGGEVDDDIAGGGEVAQGGGVVEPFVGTGDGGELVRKQVNGMKQMRADEAGGAGDADSGHVCIEFFFTAKARRRKGIRVL